MILEALARWAVYLPMLGVLGSIGARWLAARAPDARLDPSEDRALSRWGVACGLLLLVAVLARAVVQTIAAFGVDGLSLESLRTVALASRWAEHWQWQLGAAILVLFAHLAAYARRALWPLAALSAVGFAWTLPLTGHAFGHRAAWIAQSLHGLGAGLWIGTLAAVARAGRVAGDDVGEAVEGNQAADRREARTRHRLVAFAPLAMAGAGALAVTGSFLAWRELPDVGALWTSPWGRTLSLKVGLVAGVLALGAANHRRLRADRDRAPTATLRAELGLALLVLAATGWLSSSPPPGAG